MKITLESTTKIVTINTEGPKDVQCRVWEGKTDSGIEVQCLIVRVAALKTDDLSQFEKELTECKAPSPDVQAFPLRMII